MEYKVIKGIDPIDFNEIFNKFENDFIKQLTFQNKKPNKIQTKSVSIASSKFQPSDDYVYEYLSNDDLLATVYIRRNNFNTINLYISIF